MSAVVMIALNGITLGLVFALMSLGLMLLWGITELINFAYTQYLVLAMYAAYVLSEHGVGPLVALPVVVVISILANALTYLLVLRRAMKGAMLTQVLVTFGLYLLLRDGMLLIFGPEPRNVPGQTLAGSVHVFGVALSQGILVGALAGLVLAILLWLFLAKTTVGTALSAIAQDREAAGLIGLNSTRMLLLTWVIVGLCLGFAGDLAVLFTSVYPDVGTVYLLVVFAVVALGGLGSILGAVVAGVIIGIIQTAAGFYLPVPALKYAVVFGAFMLVLILRPQGLGRRGLRRDSEG